MRVAFDAYWWVEGPQSNRMVQRELIRTWVRHFPGDEALAVVPQAHRAEARATLPPGVELATTRLRPHGLAVAVDLPRLAHCYRADITVAHNFTPLTGRSVTFVHDVLFQTNPQWFTRAERAYFSAIPVLARRARAVATSTQTEADRIRAVNPRLRRVSAVGLAAGPGLADAAPRRPAGLHADRFLLTVSRLNVRKNLTRTIDAALDSATVTTARPLVVVGEPAGRTTPLGARADAARRDGALVFLERVGDDELAWLYSNTDLFCYLSLDEGFGLPPVEAAGFGAPLLVSDVPVFRETVGDRARLVDPLDQGAIATAIAALLTPASSAPDQRPTRPVERYSWTTTARALRDLAVDAARSDRREARR